MTAAALARRGHIRRGTAMAAVLAAVAVAGCGSATSGPSASHAPRARATVSASASPSSGAVPVGTTITVLAPLGLKVRDSGSPTGAVLGNLGQGSTVTVVSHSDQNGGWYEVKGETQTGWITDNPAYTSPRHFELYQSDAHGFSALYLDSWSFTEGTTAVVFHPQNGAYPQVTVANGPSIDALGPPGMAGYATVEIDPAEVYGVTGVLRLLARSGSPAPAPSGQPPLPPLLAELRVALDPHRAMRLDYLYSTSDELSTFRDFYTSIIVPTPTTAAPGAAPRPAA